MRRLALFACAAAFAAAAADAQNPTPLFRFLEHEIPPGRAPLLFGDVDLDGDVDLLDGAGALLNDGAGRFSAAAGATFGAAVDVRPLALADFDGDGDSDLLARVGAAPGTLTFLANGGGSFAPAPGFSVPSQAHATSNGGAPSPRGAFVADLEPDGDLDVVLSDPSAGFGVPTEVWRNAGGGAFALDASPFASTLVATAPYVLDVRDFDGDGDADVLARDLAGGAPNNHVVLFGAAGATLVAVATVLTPTGGPDGRALDVDGSPPLDLLLPGPPGPPHADLVVLGAAGPPVSYGSPVATARPYAAVAYLALDLDGDGTDEYGRSSSIGWEFSDVSAAGAGGSTTFALDRVAAQGALVADFDGDADLDLVAARGDGDRRAFFNASAVLVEPPGAWPDALSGGFRCVVADVDLDGDADLVGHALGVPYGPLAAAINDGRGRFAAPASLANPPPYQLFAGPVVAGDFDGNGVVDFYEGGVNPTAPAIAPPRPDVLYLGVAGGAPAWSAALLNATLTDPASGCVLVDVDGDGARDVVVARRASSPGLKQPLRVAANVGPGAFAPAVPLGAAHWISDVAAADLDGDGDRDLVGAVGPHLALPPLQPDTSFILWNQGGGTFLETSFPPNVYGGSVVAADFDLDGDPDLAFDGAVRVNVGGIFGVGAAVGPPPGTTANALRLRTAIDLDRDGYPDLLGLGGWYRNLGGSSFAAFEAIPKLALVQNGGVFLPPYGVADLDLDGDPDLVDAEARVIWNARRQVARGAPGRLGRTGSLELLGPANAPFALFAAAGVAATPAVLGGYGLVFLDLPTTVFVLDGVLDATGRVEPSFVVPPASGLAGLSLWWQAVYPADAGLTGTVETPIVAF